MACADAPMLQNFTIITLLQINVIVLEDIVGDRVSGRESGVLGGESLAVGINSDMNAEGIV